MNPPDQPICKREARTTETPSILAQPSAVASPSAGSTSAMSLAALLIALLSLSATVCGCTKNSTGPASPSSLKTAATSGGTATAVWGTASSRGYIRGDDDEDGDTYNHFDDYRIRDYGHAASPSDRRSVTALVKRYYRATAADDGSMACSLMYSRLAKDSDPVRAVPHDYAPPPGSSFPRGQSCAQFMSSLSKYDHQQLMTADIATLEVTGVRIKRLHGVVLLGFRTAPEREIPVERERGVWKIDGLLDGQIP